MTPCSVLKSFLRASVGNFNKDKETDEDGSTSAGSSDYFSPEMSVCVLAPYNFNFT